MVTTERRETGRHEQMRLILAPLKHTMRERGIADLQLARMVGVKVDVIRRPHYHMDEISLPLAEKICNALDCGLDGVMEMKKVTIIPAHMEDPDA